MTEEKGKINYELRRLKEAQRELQDDKTATAMDIIIKSGTVDANPVSPYVGEPTLRDVLANTPLTNGAREVSRNHGNVIYAVIYPTSVGTDGGWCAYAWWDRDDKEFKADLGRPRGEGTQSLCVATIRHVKDVGDIKKKHGSRAARRYLIDSLIGTTGNCVRPYVHVGQHRKKMLEEVLGDNK